MKRIILTLVACGLLLLVTAGQAGSPAKPQPYKDVNTILHAKELSHVEEVCNLAHSNINGDRERACGQAEDQAGAEYLCDSASISANCWAEYNGQ